GLLGRVLGEAGIAHEALRERAHPAELGQDAFAVERGLRRDHAPATRARGPPSVTRIPVEGRARVAWARFPALRSPGIVCGDGRNARRTGGVRPGTPGSGTRGPVRPVREPGEGPELRAGRAPAGRARPRAVRGL